MTSSHKLGFFLILLGLVWGLYLLRLTIVFEESKHRESDNLKRRIIELSKQYITALSKEHALDKVDVPAEARSTHSVEMKKATSLLLQNMLYRIKNLEDDLHYVIINSTMQFARMSEQIAFLNTSIALRANDSESFVWICEQPVNPNYPHCAAKVTWMKENWKVDPKFAKAGVNGSLCSILHYLSQVENYCPRDYVMMKVSHSSMRQWQRNARICTVPNDQAYPQCLAKVEWMKKYWKSNPYFASRGVDGSICSFIQYLSEVEDWCPLLNGRRKEEKLTCEIPKDPSFPNCAEKIAWMRNSWKLDRCYADYGVNGSICSFIIYLSEVENWCPLLPGRTIMRPITTVSTNSNEPPNLQQTGIHDLLAKLTDSNKNKYYWIKSRLTTTWKDWLAAQAELKAKTPLTSYRRRKILLFIGLLADEQVYHFGENAAKGGPLGELVQWSDLIASTYLLGHDVTVCVNKDEVKKLLGSAAKNYCPSKILTEYDIIYLDYIGLLLLKRLLGNIAKLKCRFRIVDSFGTEAQFNHLINPALRTDFGSHDLNLKQFNTMFPHSPDNTFLGFVVGRKVDENEVINKKPIALVYGKHASMWQDSQKNKLLDIVSEYFEVHATIGVPGHKKFTIPSYVKNHGVLQREPLMKLLRSAKVFVGLGFPFEGPAPLEAISKGCFFLNTKLIPPLNRENSKFFKSKPMFRKLTSQHPYAERFIGRPRVQTVDIVNKTELEAALKFMSNNTVKPYLPYEYTFEGTLQRIYALLKHQDFCNTKVWPPLRNRKVLVGKKDQSCREVCDEKDLVCEPAYFQSINDAEVLRKHTNCVNEEKKASFVAPAVNIQGNVCTLQEQKLMYSCTSKSPTFTRLCPCRDYTRGQLALCSGCL